MDFMEKLSETLVQQGLMQIEGDRVRMTREVSFGRHRSRTNLFWSRMMGLTYQMKMKIPFDMADMNGHIKLPDVILLSLQSFRDAVD